jgi:hypothetical protein
VPWLQLLPPWLLLQVHKFGFCGTQQEMAEFIRLVGGALAGGGCS